MHSYEFSMALSADKTRRIYRGQARFILVETDDGLKLQLPAINFRPHVDADGIHGRFRVRVDANNKFVSLERF